MRRLGTFWGMALVLVLGMCALLPARSAHAQVDTDQTPELSTDWTVRVGMYIFQSQAARGYAGEIGISGGVARRVYAGNNFDISVGIGFNGIGILYNIPLTINLIARSGNLRYGFGAGYAYGTRIDTRGFSAPVVNLVLGYELTNTSNPLTLDLRYYFVAGSNSETDGLGLTLGYHF